MTSAAPLSPENPFPDSAAAPAPPAAEPAQDDPAYAALTAVRNREEHLFHEVMEAARQKETSLKDLHFTTVRLSAPVDPPDLTELRERCARQFEANLKKKLDAGGNPAWISLTLPERRAPDGISVPEDSLFEQDKAARAAKEQSAKDKKKKDKDPDALPQQSALGFLFGSRGGAVLRMFLMGGAMALLYHILVFFGIIPKVF